jgi:hypothetical protein
VEAGGDAVAGHGGSSTDSFVMVADDDPDAFASALEAALNDEGVGLLGDDAVGVDDDALGAWLPPPAAPCACPSARCG